MPLSHTAYLLYDNLGLRRKYENRADGEVRIELRFPRTSQDNTRGQAGLSRQHGVLYRQRCCYHRRGVARQDRATADVEASMRRFVCQVGSRGYVGSSVFSLVS